MSFIYSNLSCIGYVLIKKIKIINANAISSPLTYGFPAITGFTGAVHALSRKVSQIDGLDDVRLDGVLIACHECQVQTYRESSYKDFTFIQTRNPLKKDGKTASIIEEGRCHLTVSLVIGIYADDYLEDEQVELLNNKVKDLIQQQRIAGGSVMGLDKFEPVSFLEQEDISKFVPKLLPAFVLTDAHDSLQAITQQLQAKNPNATALDALLETATLHHVPNDEHGSSWSVESVKKGRGWLVPIPVGYQGISPKFDAGQMQNARNSEYPSQYVEAIYSLGKWVFPYSIEKLATALWYQRYDETQDLYLVSHKSD
ncbi:type I-F CRISPR-associated protein Csy2 [Moraxella nasovis]|uniref:type I-F CRISPR-associated protein Csy2 n=1 Tax=Moraxella nasovis TaxID=2904121 RepID=UPI001F61347A|nr:type I-F CRISPR-associated protein Csy2 [Moraxella nasovis]UNU73185.1 type I-F CRISPR-associated protein Csy2 [Moraxella nasovis]